VNRTRLVRFLPYAAAIGVVFVSLAMFVAFERQTALELWSWIIDLVEAKWRRVLFGPTGQRLALFFVFLVV